MIDDAEHVNVRDDGAQAKPVGKPLCTKLGVIPPEAEYTRATQLGPGKHPEPDPYALFTTPSAKGKVGDDASCSGASIVNSALTWLVVPAGVVELAVSEPVNVTATFVAGNGPPLVTEVVAHA